jgi:hypothetical protein
VLHDGRYKLLHTNVSGQLIWGVADQKLDDLGFAVSVKLKYHHTSHVLFVPDLDVWWTNVRCSTLSCRAHL